MWAAFAGLFGKLLDFAKPALAFIFIRRATKIESERDALEETAKIQQKQNEIASRPDDPPSTVRDGMRDGDF